MGIKLSDASLRRIAATAKNEFFVEGHKDLGQKVWTDLCSMSAFHPNPSNRFSTAIAREIATEIGVVRATETHTSTPVIAAWKGSSEFHPPSLVDMDGLGANIIALMKRDTSQDALAKAAADTK